VQGLLRQQRRPIDLERRIAGSPWAGSSARNSANSTPAADPNVALSLAPALVQFHGSPVPRRPAPYDTRHPPVLNIINFTEPFLIRLYNGSLLRGGAGAAKAERFPAAVPTASHPSWPRRLTDAGLRARRRSPFPSAMTGRRRTPTAAARRARRRASARRRARRATRATPARTRARRARRPPGSTRLPPCSRVPSSAPAPAPTARRRPAAARRRRTCSAAPSGARPRRSGIGTRLRMSGVPATLLGRGCCRAPSRCGNRSGSVEGGGHKTLRLQDAERRVRALSDAKYESAFHKPCPKYRPLSSKKCVHDTLSGTLGNLQKIQKVVSKVDGGAIDQTCLYESFPAPGPHKSALVRKSIPARRTHALWLKHPAAPPEAACALGAT
jgi:hypothetical protein